MKIQKINNPKEIAELFYKAHNILLLPHIIPDGDTIGSSIALYLALKKLGKNPYVLIEDDIPYNIEFLMPYNICYDLDEEIVLDLVVSIDCSDTDRLGDRRKYVDQVKSSLNIDHHVTNTNFAMYNYVDSKAAATGELVYSIIKALEVPITKDIATCIYTALSTDTGSFKYDNTSPKTHRIAAELLEKNIDLNRITTEIYQKKPIHKVRLLSAALNTLEFYFEGKLAILSITKDMLEENKAKIEDADNFIEFARDIDGVEVGVLLKEVSKNQIKVGFRAKYDVDVSKVAKVFDGGGHKKASGCTIYSSIEEAKRNIVKIIDNYL
ncbi:bifunctional oligoribonuclease/PAP phosphatase NrnA [Crassaminicella thermophila]|uniref:Bifunctional oligoribonuclease/PAP phosphatase NrnA n=1 Tax=Crassaminicella thermophila TaxID=2599308 RepID=A0A5C0SGX9_CRATE|nr:bifunctional oligoribonuclease/PAP phosphatase NrnA [Crassaminicella thermophila]QEK12229.1 bifunctional oligoribonuclease/PAP phosphatase NrnA [Crassaminicella thermophila]